MVVVVDVEFGMEVVMGVLVVVVVAVVVDGGQSSG